MLGADATGQPTMLRGAFRFSEFPASSIKAMKGGYGAFDSISRPQAE
jgi:hypothetical protein